MCNKRRNEERGKRLRTLSLHCSSHWKEFSWIPHLSGSKNLFMCGWKVKARTKPLFERKKRKSSPLMLAPRLYLCWSVSKIPCWPAGVRVVQASPCVCTRASVIGMSLCWFTLPTPPSTWLKLPHTTRQHFIWAGPSHTCTHWPSTPAHPPPPFFSFPMRAADLELFHPVHSCTHLFSTSKTQGLRGGNDRISPL